jgi:hypothetical protein
MSSEKYIELTPEERAALHTLDVSGVASARDIGRRDAAHERAGASQRFALAQIAIEINLH